MGWGRETISFLEKREYNPSLKLAIKIARNFQVNIE
ncbi:helix-turn-helix domain-containing protein [Thalassobacillus sp. CUG 92003]